MIGICVHLCLSVANSRPALLGALTQPMRNLKLTLAYDGTDFNGWQIQPGFRTVQETLETAIATLTGEQIRVNASGRTDTGVHALGQVVNFYTNTGHPPDVLLRAVNAHLPADVVVSQVEDVAQAFDAN